MLQYVVELLGFGIFMTENAKVIDSVKMVGMRVGDKNSIQPADFVTQGLLPEIRADINEVILPVML